MNNEWINKNDVNKIPVLICGAESRANTGIKFEIGGQE